MVVPFGKRVTSGEVPALNKSLRDKLSESVRGATDADVQQKAVAANPSRLLVRMKCWRCTHAWQAPNKGNCPQCHCPIVEILEAVPCMAARI